MKQNYTSLWIRLKAIMLTNTTLWINHTPIKFLSYNMWQIIHTKNIYHMITFMQCTKTGKLIYAVRSQDSVHKSLKGSTKGLLGYWFKNISFSSFYRLLSNLIISWIFRTMILSYFKIICFKHQDQLFSFLVGMDPRFWESEYIPWWRCEIAFFLEMWCVPLSGYFLYNYVPLVKLIWLYNYVLYTFSLFISYFKSLTAKLMCIH